MSTDYTAYENPQNRTKLVVTEGSSQFDLDAYVYDNDWRYVVGQVTLANNLKPEQVVDIAMLLLQPLLYNVADPKEFMEKVIKAKLEKLFV